MQSTVDDKNGKPLAKGMAVAASVDGNEMLGFVWKVFSDSRVVIVTYGIEYKCGSRDCTVLDANNVETSFKNVVVDNNLDNVSALVSRPKVQVVRDAFDFCRWLMRDEERVRTLFGNKMAELEGTRQRKERLTDKDPKDEDIVRALLTDPKATKAWAQEEREPPKKCRCGDKATRSLALGLVHGLVHGLALGLGSMLARSVQCYLLCLVRVFQQAMRNVLTNVLTAIAADAPISTSDKGSLLAAIPLGYFLTQVPGGALADRIGAKTVMLTALALSAVCCLILPTAFDQLGVYGLLATLTTMGAVQGPMFPTSSVLLARWMPKARPGEPDEKAWGTSMLDIGISIGTLLIIPTTSVLAEWVGWRHTFHCIGGASLAFCALYGVFAASAPAQCWYISTAERDYLEANVPQPSAPSGSAKGSDGRTAESGNSSTSLFARIVGMPSAVALHPGLWAVFCAHMAFNFGAYYLTNWSPTYYKDVLGVPPAQAALHLMLPHLTNLAAKSANPMLVGALASRGYSLLASRKAFTCAGFVLASIVLSPVPLLRHSSVWGSTLLFSAANACFGLAPSGFKANYLDVTEEYVGLVAGYGNTLGTVASFVQPKLLARILDATGATAQSTASGSWGLVLTMVALVNLLAAANYALHATVSPVERIVKKEQKE